MSKIPVGGVIWLVAQYAEGFRRLGFDPYYVEAHGRVPSMFMEHQLDDGTRKACAFIARQLARFDMADKWAYQALHEGNVCHGMSRSNLDALYRDAALIINLHGGTVPLDEHAATGRLAYLGTDPVETELEVHRGEQIAIEFLERHNAFFTWGLNYGKPDCALPWSDRFNFVPSPPPVVMDFWNPNSTRDNGLFTTVGNWRQVWREVEFEGEIYHWSKHLEFEKIIELPSLTDQSFELALSSLEDGDRRRLTSHGWRVADGLGISREPGPYRDYILASRGELTVAKDQNVRLRTGWFSERSATYLAAGRPVIMQDTGFSSYLPEGAGLVAFHDLETAASAVRCVASDYAAHRSAARDIADEFLNYEVVLPALLDHVGVEVPLQPTRPRRRAGRAERGVREDESNTSSPVLIVGMHRSGTSMVTHVLRDAGLHLGADEDLIAANEANTDGYWEHQEIVHLNDALLHRYGGSWEKPPAFSEGWHLDIELADLRANARVLTTELAGGKRWAWKDPRGSLVIPFWVDLEPECKIVLCVRNPTDVAASLKKRSFLSRSFSRDLWRVYNESVLRDAPPERLVVTHYESWMADPVEELRRVAALLDLDLDEATVAAASCVVAADLRHHNAAAVQGGREDDLTLHEIGCYSKLRELAGLPTSLAMRFGASLTELSLDLKARADEAAAAQDRAIAAEREVHDLTRVVEEACKSLATAQDLLVERAEIDRTIAALKSELDERALMIEQLADASRPQVTLERELAAHEARIARSEDAFEDLAPHTSAPGTAQRSLTAAVSAKREHQASYGELKERLRSVVAGALPEGASIAVVSRGDDDLLVLGARIGFHFPRADDGRYAGFHPRDDDAAIAHLEEVRALGVGYLVLPSTSAWWLEYYPRFATYLDTQYARILTDDACAIFDVRGVGTLGAGTPHPPEPVLASPSTDGTAVIPIIEQSGLFDEEFYRASYLGDYDEYSPLEHFAVAGWRQGWCPNDYFDTSWYRQRYATEMRHDNPLVDYIASRETRKPSPLFDPQFYASKYLEGRTVGALADYIDHVRRGVWRDPVPLFDVAYYLTENPDVRDASVNPVLHYLHFGHLEGRDPSAEFATQYYRRTHLGDDTDVNPLVHYYAVGEAKALPTRLNDHLGLHNEIRTWTAPGPEYEALDRSIAMSGPGRAKVLAFYLPQFHAIPENDEWWGTGFTEWRNVARGVPRFQGHYQPRIPRDLGFYDLSDPRTMPKQVDLARASGLHGFAFYYYWFNGNRLLDGPLDQFLNDKSLDFNFSIIWANENWTRRWDGQEQDVLIRQDYDEELDIQLVDDLQRYFADPRYIRVDGRPLLKIYRIDIVTDGAIDRWRKIWRERHGENPVILIAQTFGTMDPRPHGADGAFEFPPHKLTASLRSINHELEFVDPAFSGWVFDYTDVIVESIEEEHPPYPLIKTAVPSWDNDARRQGSGAVLNRSSPALFEEWLRSLLDIAEMHPVFDERLVFINAWNEWAEAAYLEPDVHYGSAYLNAAARAISGSSRCESEKRKLLLVGHDAHAFGAQINLWHIGDTLRNQFGCEVSFLLAGDGDLVSDYEQLGSTFVASDPLGSEGVIEELRDKGYKLAIVNSVAAGSVAPMLKRAGFAIVSLVHELPRIIDEYNLGNSLVEMAGFSDKLVVPAEVVAEGVRSIASGLRTEIVVRPQGLYRTLRRKPTYRRQVRRQLGVPTSARVVLNVGSADLRKGIDTFMHVANLALQRDPNLHFIWVGKRNPNVTRWLDDDLPADLAERVHFVDYTDDVAPYFAAADVFFLSSREDPFPSVVLEALSVGLPVVALSGCGGMEAVVSRHGTLVPRHEIDAVVAALSHHAYEDNRKSRVSRIEAIRKDFRFDDYCFDLLQMLDPTLRKVSVVVPNYNYGSLLACRLESIFDQTYPVFEVIVLDDASTDDSLDELDAIRLASERRIDSVVNRKNSGSVFAQWRRACADSRGEFLWIAEADDLARPEFLERVLSAMTSSDATLAFADSAQVDEHGQTIGASYKDYYSQVVGPLMDDDFAMDGADFVRQCLSERNLLLNVSATVWQRRALLEAIESSVDELRGFKLAGDWYLYIVACLRESTVAYVSTPLSIHRRHTAGVTQSLDKERHLSEIQRVHEVIHSRVHPDGRLRKRMAAYVEALRAQFGIAEATEA